MSDLCTLYNAHCTHELHIIWDCYSNIKYDVYMFSILHLIKYNETEPLAAIAYMVTGLKHDSGL